jgi:mono/diheme cytochrome c family protein
MRRPLTALLLAGSALACACGSPPPRREWTPPPRPIEEPGAGNELPPDDRDPMARAGQALWNVSCAGCHGRGGRGDGEARPPGATLPDLASAAWHEARTDGAILTVIRDGRGLMPEFGSKMHAQAIEALVAHVRSLREAAP